MGKRLTKIVTKTGDNGTTGIYGKIRVNKNHPQIKIIGELDELGCYLGLAKYYCKKKNFNNHPLLITKIIDELSKIQNDLFTISGSLVMKKNLLKNKRIIELENEINHFNQFIPSLQEFITAEGGIAGLQINFARAFTRRVERTWWDIEISSQKQFEKLGQYLNRLSDWLFVAMRIVNSAEMQEEKIWNNPITPKNAKRNRIIK